MLKVPVGNIRKVIKNCSDCGEILKFFKKYKTCANLGCISYRVKIRRYDANNKEG